jgi:hypothetical protein
MSKEFDFDAYKVLPDKTDVPRMKTKKASAHGTTRRPRQNIGVRFIQITIGQLARLEKAHNLATLKVFLELMRLDFKGKHHGKPFVFSNDRLGKLGITRKTKATALAELETLGLITTMQRGLKKSPLVAVFPLQ